MASTPSWTLSVDLHWREITNFGELVQTISGTFGDDLPVGDCPGYFAQCIKNAWPSEGEPTITRSFFKAHDPASGPWPMSGDVMDVYLDSLAQAISFEAIPRKSTKCMSYAVLPAACIAEFEAIPRFNLPYFIIPGSESDVKLWDPLI